MNQKIKNLLAATLLVSSLVAREIPFSSVTPTLESTLVTNNRFNSIVGCKQDSNNALLTLSAGYQASYKSKDLTVFGVADSNTVSLKQSATNSTDDVNLSYMLRQAAGVPLANNSITDATLTLEPKRTVVFAHGAFHYDLNQFAEGAWFRVETAFARVKNDLQAKVSGGVPANAAATNGLSVQAFFNGESTTAGTAAGSSAALNFARIPSTAPAAEQGFADVNALAGYDFVKNSSGKLGGFLRFVIPTGNKDTAVNLWGPRYGQNHVGIGGGLSGKVNLVDSKNYEASFGLLTDYVWYLTATEKRTVGLQAGSWNYPQYFLASQAAASVAASTTIAPAANYLTQDVDVKPRGKFNGLFNFNVETDCAGFSVGYHLNYNQAESNTLKPEWTNGTFYLLQSVAATGASTTTGAEIKDSDLLLNAPSVTSHAAVANFSYRIDGDTPIALNAGASVDLASNDKTKAEKAWAVFGGIGVSW